jgi:hypothetical protein
MKRWALILIVLLIPAGFFVSAWQAFTHQTLSQEIRGLEGQQLELLDANKKLLTIVAQMESPLLITDRAKSELNMDWPRQDQLRTLRIREAEIEQP